MANVYDPACRARQTTIEAAKKVLSYLETGELMGIDDFPHHLFSDLNVPCVVDPYDQRVSSSHYLGDYLFFRQIFSTKKVSCIPAGKRVSPDTPENLCCTGNIINNRCSLPPYVDVSLFLNKHISSTATVAEKDPRTGYLVNPLDVIRIACEKNICSTGILAPGTLLSPLATRGHEDSFYRTQRFIDGDDHSNTINGLSDLFNKGLKWNNHFYCVPNEPLPGAISCDKF